MKLSRRTFFKVNVAGAAALAVGAPQSAAASSFAANPHARGVLVDTTRCVGCRACEAACSEANTLAQPALSGDERVFDSTRDTDQYHYTVVNRFENVGGVAPVRFVKKQCMHCVEPACVSACPARALEKTEDGAGHLHGQPLPRVPLLHDGVPVRRAEVRVRQGRSVREEVHVLRGAPGQRPAARVRGGLPERRAPVRHARGAARGSQDAHLPDPRQVRASRVRRDSKPVARAGSTSPTCRSIASG